MAETVYEIEAHIDRTRKRLGSNLRELERRVESATDWRAQFRARPLVGLGVACAGGVLLAAVLRSRGRRRPRRTAEPRHDSARRVGIDARVQARELWDDIQEALIGVYGARVKEQIGSLLPGFDEHVRRAEQRRAPTAYASGR